MTATKGLEGLLQQIHQLPIIDDKLTYVGYDIDDLTENASLKK